MEITITRDIFKAAQHAMATKDIRYYLNGVCIRLSRGSDEQLKGQAYSTDGHIAFLCDFEVIDERRGSDPAPDFLEMLIPIDVVKHVAKGKLDLVTLTSLDKDKYIIDSMAFTPIDGQFPDIGRIVPATKALTNEPAQFNPNLLVRADKALRAWFGMGKTQFPTLYHSGNNAALLCGPNDSAVCVVMPMREDKEISPISFTVTSRKKEQV